MNKYRDESPNYEDYKLKNDKGQDISFHGLLIGHVSTELQKTGKGGRWFEVSCFKTKSNTLIYRKLGCSDKPGEQGRSTITVAETPEELMDACGYDELNKSLYEQCGFTHQKHID